MKVKVNRVEGLRCEILVDWARLEKVSEFKYLGIINKSGTDDADCRRKVASGRKVASAIRSQVNNEVCSLRVLHKALFVLILLYGSETMIWRERERSRIMDMQMDNLRYLLDIRRMD